MSEKIETLVVGGGQAGLSTSYCLSQQGSEHVVLEQAARPGNAWRNDRWESFSLLTPNWSFKLPGAEYAGDDPDGFMPRAEIVARFEQYEHDLHLPVHHGVQVEAVEPLDGGGYRVRANSGDWQARNVVVASGLYQTPKIPLFGAALPGEIHQAPSGRYQNPAALPPGAVLVVGSGQSGCQIAEELYQAGRKVYLCIGSAGRAPRRYRGRDVFDWLERTRFLDRTPDKLPSPQARFAANPHLSGKSGGHTVNLHQFCRDGVTLLGRMVGIESGQAFFAPDRNESLFKADQFEANLCKLIDDYIERNAIQTPEEQLPVLKDGYDAPENLSLDLKQAGIGAVIWALGYRFDFSLVKAPVFDDFGFPVTVNCATRSPGLYFAGLPWLVTQKSGLLMGVGVDAARIAGQIYAQDGKAGG